MKSTEKAYRIIQKPFLILILLPLYVISKDAAVLTDELSVSFLALIAFATVVVQLNISGLLRLFGFRTWKNAITAGSAILIPILFFGPLHDLLKASSIPGVLTSYRVTVPVLTGAIILFLFTIRKHSLQRLSTYLNATLIILTFLEFVIILDTFRRPASSRLLDSEMKAMQEFQRHKLPDTLPDIFFLVFDSYSSSYSLKKTLQFDNTAADQHLKENGFRIFNEACSNFNHTLLSISSIFNMSYPQLPEDAAQDISQFYYKANRSLQTNALFNILKANGYDVKTTQHLSMQRSKSSLPGYFDVMIVHHYVYRTLPGRLYRDLGYLLKQNDFFSAFFIQKQDSQCKRLYDYTQQSIAAIQNTCSTESDGPPQFMYAHFMIPHEPWCFDSHGSIRPGKEVYRDSNFVTGYLQQVQYTNQIIKQLVLQIQNNNRPNTLIIIAGDHGYRSHNDVDMREHIFRIRFAAYHPQPLIEDWPESISGVNIFRLVLNTFLGAQMELLPHEAFYLQKKTNSERN